LFAFGLLPNHSSFPSNYRLAQHPRLPPKPPKMSSKPPKRPQPRHDDIDNYNLGDVSDSDPFATPSPPSKKPKTSSANPGSPNNLGIDEEVSVAKRVRVPNVKLDEDRLLSANGIPKLRSRAGSKLKLKGKGHEWSDAERLLSFYQDWLHDLFPKARFVDALGMVEKAGHKRKLTAARGG
jgi:replication fork protection complex subunit Csm3/Swi3